MSDTAKLRAIEALKKRRATIIDANNIINPNPIGVLSGTRNQQEKQENIFQKFWLVDRCLMGLKDGSLTVDEVLLLTLEQE